MTDHSKPTTYFQMQRELEQQLELDATADGHDALRLQAEKGRLPEYPRQPNNVWNEVDRGPAPRFDIGPDGRPELVKLVQVKRGER